MRRRTGKQDGFPQSAEPILFFCLTGPLGTVITNTLTPSSPLGHK
jgi:hypothetical protein